MSKTSPEELVKSVSSEMTSFLKNGEINPDFIENNLEYKGIDRIQDLESILRVHFVLPLLNNRFPPIHGFDIRNRDQP